MYKWKEERKKNELRKKCYYEISKMISFSLEVRLKSTIKSNQINLLAKAISTGYLRTKQKTNRNSFVLCPAVRGIADSITSGVWTNPYIIHLPCLWVKIKRNAPGANINQLLILCAAAVATAVAVAAGVSSEVAHTSGILGMLQITLNTRGVAAARNFLY